MWSDKNPFGIVMCTFNGERFLDEQLHSLRVQAGVREIVITDDQSTDGTWAILQRHASEDARIRIFVNSVRQGVTANFQRALELSTAPWVALADQDDVWLPGKLARMRAVWDGESGLMHHASLKFKGAIPRTARHLAHDRRKFRGQDWRRLLFRNSVVGHTVLIRRDLARRIMPFPRGLPHDWWIGMGAAVHGRVQFLDEYLVFYRIHQSNAYHVAGSRWRRIKEDHGLRVRILDALLATEDWPLRGREFAEEYCALLRDRPSGLSMWRLWHFYWRHASLFFAGAGFERSRATYFRRSVTAAVCARLSSIHAPGQRIAAARTVFQ